ncbi:hypothetical protein D7Y25_04100 [Parabacteroides goldsteinii]|jgi:hypothetical protein|uniref:Uncharacterized protein n=2 Tax=Tannerellaceae TaxID=2005525 RepID=S0GGB4_9BACT|nr:hypothetical protein C803_04078 [Parabacteroides goldsteinii dnLKV18]KAI4363534.1 hypothetical protein C825_005654 [Parabacteroides sp. ASF519]NBI94424.1 hypothetical protein [Parabacteroides goldsteinii]RLT86476.1 hypothetical protein D7Y25_04100 [Parabacteroides goldsteinii]
MYNLIKSEDMKELIIFILVFEGLFWVGVKLQRWINGTSKITKNQKKILKEMKRKNNLES